VKVVWLAVPEFPGYAVSNTGLVLRTVDGVILAQRPNHGGYLRVVLWRGGKPTHRRVHALVLEAFKGPRPSPREHGAHAPDRSKLNNTIANLRWATPEENEADKKAHGTHKGGGKVKPLTDFEVDRVRLWHAGGASLASIASRLGVHRSTISRAVRGLHHKPRAA
jgi:hypothetical protein